VDWCVQCALLSEVKAVTTLGGQGYGFAFVADRDSARPMSGLIAAIATLKAAGCDSALLMTIDAPAVLPSDLQPLLARRGGARFKGLPLPMLLPFDAVPGDLDLGWSLDQLAEAAGLATVYPPVSSRLRLKGAYTLKERQAVIAAMPR
jgi:hypothetical protein